jgi:hypothetical protein
MLIRIIIAVFITIVLLECEDASAALKMVECRIKSKYHSGYITYGRVMQKTCEKIKRHIPK